MNNPEKHFDYNLMDDSQLVSSYNSLNSHHFDVIKPGLTESINYEEPTSLQGKLRRWFCRRGDSLVEPHFEDKHVISVQDEKTFFQLFVFAVKYSLWVFFTTLPTILIVCLVAFGYSRIPWTHECPLNGTQPCIYYSKKNLFYFDFIVRQILLSIIPVLVAYISVNNADGKLVKYLLFISVPMITIIAVLIPGMISFNGLWYYYVDIIMFVIVFILTLSASMFLLTRCTDVINITFKQLLRYFLLPGIIATLGVGFIDAVINKKYQTMKNHSIGQYLIRIIFYPIIVDLLISFGEVNMRKVPNNGSNHKSHVIYFYQVAFTTIGRYMTTISGCLVSIFIMTASIALRDVFFHRMSRIQCWIAFKMRSCLRKISSGFIDNEFDKFEDWFFSKEFTSFKASILNNEFTIELIGVILVPFVMVTFDHHSLLFHFKDVSFKNKDGSLNYVYILRQESVQILFVFLTLVLITMLEAKFNHVNLREAYKKVGWLEYFSQTLIHVWSILLLISSVRATTNYFQCDEMNDICSCTSGFIELHQYRC